MSALVAGDGQQLLLTKGAPESVLSRCNSALANAGSPPTGSGGGGDQGRGFVVGSKQVVPLTEGMRHSLMEKMGQYGGACDLAWVRGWFWGGSRRHFQWGFGCVAPTV